MRGLVWRCGALLVAAAVVCSGVLWGCGAVAVWCFAVGGVLLCAVGCCGWWVVCCVAWRFGGASASQTIADSKGKTPLAAIAAPANFLASCC